MTGPQRWLSLVLVLASLGTGLPARAVNPDEILPDQALEARARAISVSIRCVVCRNQNIDESNADIAADMRILLRERLVAGDSDAQAVAYLVDRYGSFILLNPPFEPATYLLWAAPGLLLLIAGFGFSRLWRRGPMPEDAELSDADRARAEKLLQGPPPT